jgi:hypothetical protein
MPAITFDNVVWAIVFIALVSPFFVRGRFERYAWVWAARAVFYLGLPVVAAVRGAWLLVAIVALAAALMCRWSRLYWHRARSGER